MFGMGGSEILLILIIALLFLGPDKLPEAAKTISKTVRDLKKQTRVLQQTIEEDEHIGGAIRDLKSALRGEEIPVRKKPAPKLAAPQAAIAAAATEAKAENVEKAEEVAKAVETIAPLPDVPPVEHAEALAEAHAEDAAPPKVRVTAPTAGEADDEVPETDDDEELAAMVKPAAGIVAKSADAKGSEPHHG
ncbi:MAG TPA: twin-arginine translocase TatA/TatE family subunit [Kofleriaceae bacterium]